MDFDIVVLNNDKQDAKTSYKITKTYHSCFPIMEIPLFISKKETKYTRQIQNEFSCNISVFVQNLSGMLAKLFLRFLAQKKKKHPDC